MPLRDGMRDAKAARLTQALLANVENWERRAVEISDLLPAGQKGAALSLARDIEAARCSLARLIRGLDET